jgi:hypothetical protein
MYVGGSIEIDEYEQRVALLLAEERFDQPLMPSPPRPPSDVLVKMRR